MRFASVATTLFHAMRTVVAAAFIAAAILANPANADESEKPMTVYVSIGGEDRIAAFTLNPTTGELVHHGDVALPGAPGSLGIDSTGEYLYAALRTTKSVAVLRRDSDSEKLELLTSAPVAGNPVYVVPDATDNFLLTAYYGENRAATFQIDENRNVNSKPITLLELDKNPHSIGTDPSNRFAFVPNTGADFIFQFRFDSTTGRLSPNDPAKIAVTSGAGPRHFCFHPKLPMAYFVNEKDSTVTSFRFDKDKGTLEERQTLPTLPEDFSENNTCADIHVTPDGRHLYASNRGHDSLAGYRLNETGEMTAIGRFPTEQTPREFDIDPSGRFVVAAGQGSGRIASYRIDQKTGELEKLHVLEAGKSPAWVLVLPRKK